jgi:hypothetical protein
VNITVSNAISYKGTGIKIYKFKERLEVKILERHQRIKVEKKEDKTRDYFWKKLQNI